MRFYSEVKRYKSVVTRMKLDQSASSVKLQQIFHYLKEIDGA